MDTKPIENKVKKNKKLVTIDLKQFFDDTPIKELDIKDFLYQELLLKEKDFRESLENHDWSQYEDSYLVTYCSTDAIVAPWAYMLVAQYASEYARDVLKGSKEEMLNRRFQMAFDDHDWSQYQDKRVLLKGCSDVKVTEAAYVMATNKLIPYVDRIMYGEACSFVPVYRRPKQKKKK